MSWYSEGRNALQAVTVLIVLFFFIVFAIITLIYTMGGMSLEDYLANALTPSIVTILTYGGGAVVILIIVYAILCAIFNVKPFWAD